MKNKKYEILYVAPLWNYAKCSKVSYEYPPVLSTTDMKELAVSELANKDSLLFLWANTKQLKEAIELGEAWDFKYITVAFVWDKKWVNPATYTLQQCEFCLLFKKGKMPAKVTTKNVKQLVSCRRIERFKKPIEIREAIDKMFPNQSKLQLFFNEDNQTKNWDQLRFEQLSQIEGKE